jgi:hypothetical protein
MARISLIDERDRPDLAALVGKIRAGRRGSLINVYKLLLHCPLLAEIWLALIDALRTHSVLGARLREIAIIRWVTSIVWNTSSTSTCRSSRFRPG